MRNLLLLFVFIFLNSNLSAQGNINLVQYVSGVSLINPAYSGANGRFTSQFISSNQWIGVEGAPKTNALIINSPLTKFKLGLGASIINEKIGPISETTFNLNTAYHTKLNDNIILSYGLKTIVGFHNQNYIGEELIDLGDPYFQKTPNLNVFINFGAGIYLSSRKFVLSYSATPLIKNSFSKKYDDYEVSYSYNNLINHYLMGVLIFDVSKEIKLKPSVLFKSNENLETTMDMCLAAVYNEAFWLGLTYRSNNAMSVFTQLEINEKIRLGYAFDYGIIKDKTLNSGSHEIILTFDLQLRKNSYITPRFL